MILVELKWLKVPKREVEVGLNQELALECEAQGSPQPTIEWYKYGNSTDNDAVEGEHFEDV